MRPPLRRAAAGFTLVEIVIALSLISLLMLALVAALRTFGDSGARLEARSERADDMRLVSGFLRQIVGEASFKHMRALDNGAEVADFHGEVQMLEWLAPMPARHGVGGLHWLRLGLRPEGEEHDLVLQLTPYVPPQEAFRTDLAARPDWQSIPERILARRVGSFSLSYQRLGRTDWLPEWVDVEVLPGLVAIRIVADGVRWPDLIVAVLAAEPGFDLNVDRAEPKQ